MVLSGLLFGLITGGRAGIVNSLIGLSVSGGIFFFFWLLKAMGGADVKLMAGVGAFLGWPAVLDALFFTALAGGVMAILFLIWKRKPKGGEPEVSPRKQTLPYGVAIAVGTVLSMII